jgi:hypothetical protein
MNQVIIYANQDGGVAMCFPTGELPIEVVRQKDIPQGVESFIVNKDSLPDCWDYSMAWELSAGLISINITKAREATKDRLRLERKELFVNLDVAFQRAIESGADTSAIVAEKQRLRDITNLPDACNTIEELRALSV